MAEETSRGGHLSRSPRFLGPIIALMVSIGLGYAAYFFQAGTSGSGLNPFEAFAALIFWGAIAALILLFPLRSIWKSFQSYVKTSIGTLIFVIYMSIHLLVYGFTLETILTSLAPATTTNIALQPYVSISAGVLSPPALQNILLSFFIYPNVTLLLSSFLLASLSLYSMAMAVIIGILVETNIMKAIELKGACSRLRRSSAFVAMPVIGVLGGASCCLSLPFLLAFVEPIAFVESFAYQVAYYVTYFLFPAGTALALALNLNSISKVAKTLTKKAVVTQSKK